MREWGIFQPRYLATKLIHQPDELAGVSIADSANGSLPPAERQAPGPHCRQSRFRTNQIKVGATGAWHLSVVPGTCQW